MDDENLILQVRFYRTAVGNEPVREWLSELAPNDRKAIGKDIKTVQFSWPLGMPLVRKLEAGLWEVRSCPIHGGGCDHGVVTRLRQEKPKDTTKRTGNGKATVSRGTTDRLL